MTDRLGAPPARAGWKHGSAGRVDDGCRIDCWIQCQDAVISASRFEVFGGLEAMAMAGWLADWMVGREMQETAAVTGRWIADSVGVSAEARGDALQIEDALRAALAATPLEDGGDQR